MGKMYFDFGGALQRPQVLEVEPTEACNLKCRMCHVSYMKLNKRRIDFDALKKLRPLSDAFVSIGSNFEPTLHPKFPDIVSMFADFGFTMDIVTNGTLLTDRIDSAMARGKFNLVTISFDGIRKETYEYIRRNARFERTVNNVTKLRRAFSHTDTVFSINYVLMRCNIDELIEAIDFWDEHDFHMLGLIFMTLRDTNEELQQQNLYPVHDYAYGKLDEAARHLIEKNKGIAISCPYYSMSPLREVYPGNFLDGAVMSDKHGSRSFAKLDKNALQRGSFPGMRFKGCQSAFKFARILSNGDVQLCHKYIIGNLHADDFDDIWFGEKAYDIRKKLMATTHICSNCDYWLFCLNQLNLDISDPKNYLKQELREAQKEPIIEEGIRANSTLLHLRTDSMALPSRRAHST